MDAKKYTLGAKKITTDELEKSKIPNTCLRNAWIHLYDAKGADDGFVDIRIVRDTDDGYLHNLALTSVNTQEKYDTISDAINQTIGGEVVRQKERTGILFDRFIADYDLIKLAVELNKNFDGVLYIDLLYEDVPENCAQDTGLPEGKLWARDNRNTKYRVSDSKLIVEKP